MAVSSSPSPKDFRETFQPPQAYQSLPDKYAYTETVTASRYQPLELVRCHKQPNGQCELVRVLGLWDKRNNQWLQGYPCYVAANGLEWCGDPSKLRPAFGGKPDCRGPIPGPPGIQGLQGPIGLTGPKGDIGPIGPQGPIGPEADCAAVDADCAFFQFDQQDFCGSKFGINATGATLGPNPGLNPDQLSFNPSALPAAQTFSTGTLFNYTNNTDCCQEIVCSMRSGNTIDIITDRGSVLSVAVWAEDEAGSYIEESFHKCSEGTPINSASLISTQSCPIVSTPWTRKLNPGETHSASINMGLLSYTLSPLLADFPETPISSLTFNSIMSNPCITCRVTTVGQAQ